MYRSHHISAILLMGGCGSRFSPHTPKQFHMLSGKKIYLHTLETFLSLEVFDEILLVCLKEYLEEVRRDISHYKQAPISLIPGGFSRQESSYLGLQALAFHDIVLLHDAVRPFVSRDILMDNISAAIESKACDTCIPSHDTIIYTEDLKVITQIPNRNHLMRGQTPQTFHYDLLMQAHKHALKEKIYEASDDCQLVKNLGHEILIVRGSDDNIKITTEFDFLLAEQLLRKLEPLKSSNKDFSSFKGKVFAITGGSGGIGLALLKQLKTYGALALDLSRSSQTFAVDLTSEKQTANIFKKLHQEYGPLDGLINCIGYLKTSKLKDLSGKDIRKMISTNFTSVAYASKYCSLKKGSHLLNIASSSFSRGRADYTIYSSMKAAIVNFTQGLALEHPELFINTAIPSRTDTSMRRSNFPHESKELLLDPEDVATNILEILNQDISGTLIEIRKK